MAAAVVATAAASPIFSRPALDVAVAPAEGGDDGDDKHNCDGESDGKDAGAAPPPPAPGYSPPFFMTQRPPRPFLFDVGVRRWYPWLEARPLHPTVHTLHPSDTQSSGPKQWPW